MKLYRITVEVETWLLSEEKPDHYAMAAAAEREARENGLQDAECYGTEVTDVAQVPEEIRDTLPWGKCENKTLEQWCEKIAAEASVTKAAH